MTDECAIQHESWVVDDTPANREILETRLISQGYEVLVAKDGEEALAIARQSTPDLILLDVMMPGKDGFEVCRGAEK